MGNSARKKKLIEMTENMLRSTSPTKIKQYHLQFLTETQKLAWDAFQQNDILFLTGAAGSGKSFLAVAFAIHEILEGNKEKIVLTRPLVEAGENLGFLPGDISEKVFPYMLPLYDCLEKMCGRKGEDRRDYVDRRIELAPIAYLRGRSQPVDAKIATPDGYKQMGNMVIGSSVLGRNGQPTKVTGVYPQGELDVYRVHFSDGTSVECSDDHLWSTMTLSEKRHGKGFTVKTTRQIREKIKTSHGKKNHRVPVNNAVFFSSEKPLTINPYVLGTYLGDPEIITEVSSRLPDDIQAGLECNLGLLGKKSWEKFVPNEYKFTSIENRLNLLRGLMDTDGWIGHHPSGNNRIQYCSTSAQLADDVAFIVRSLGGVASIRKCEYTLSDKGQVIKHCRPRCVVEIAMTQNPFMLPGKATLFKEMNLCKFISKVEYVGKKTCQCIKVEAADSLYLTEHFIVTHNSFENSVCVLDEAQNCTLPQFKLFLSRLGRNSKMIITGDPSQSDLGKNPDLLEVINRVSGIEGINTVTFNEQSIVRHPLVAKILRNL